MTVSNSEVEQHVEAQMADLVATVGIDIDAPPERVWAALTDPREIEQYMFGSQVESEWTAGASIVWTGEYGGKTYEDKGVILAIEPVSLLEMTHSSGGDEHTLTYRLKPRGAGTHLSLSQDNNASQDEADHSHKTWQAMLSQLKSVVESSVI
jgi:uncharacterized protein YndB with AHSA1/START domain